MNQLTLPRAQLPVARVTQADINVNALSRCLHTTTIAAMPDGYRCVEITGDLPDRRYCRALVKWKESDTLNFEVDVGIFGHREGQSLPSLLAGDGICEYSDLGVAFNALHARKNTLLAELDASAARERQKSPGQLAYERDLAVQPRWREGSRYAVLLRPRMRNPMPSAVREPFFRHLPRLPSRSFRHGFRAGLRHVPDKFALSCVLHH